ncbi:alpha/beta hydrolase [Rickettsiales bacterium LUAb2]
MLNYNFFNLPNNEKLCYYLQEGNSSSPIIIFLPGYMSDIKGVKASSLANFAKESNLSYLCFEYRGHGQSSGNLFDFIIEDWFQDTVAIINSLTKNRPKILIGSSMGGWLAFLYSHYFSENIKGLIAIAPALDFTKDLNMLLISNSPNIKQEDDIISFTYPTNEVAKFSKKLITNTKEDLFLLNKSNLYFNFKVRLLHGMQDNIVNYQNSINISQKLTNSDVIISLFKNGDHSLSKPDNLLILQNTILELINT